MWKQLSWEVNVADSLVTSDIEDRVQIQSLATFIRQFLTVDCF